MEPSSKKSCPSLNARQKTTAVSKPLKLDSVVWILQEFTPRGLWPLGRSISPVSHGKEVEFPREGQYRQYKVRTPRGEQVNPAIRLSVVETKE